MDSSATGDEWNDEDVEKLTNITHKVNLPSSVFMEAEFFNRLLYGLLHLTLFFSASALTCGDLIYLYILGLHLLTVIA